jgi:hypothetical protein
MYMPGKFFKTLAPGSAGEFAVEYRLGLVDNSTRLFVTALTDDYIVSRYVNLTLATPPSIQAH